ncbi:hypothetical protein SISNIDRAFT_499347 [Sistotremastrum niveocremeum HHB9708]|uniref:Uncharacterized protein n=1 Tax=Sistotremastrum niveocremeum HHB9708 TaxID=1314777 RepID=A0A165AEH8_9AGAM|nr:hypothetical protein SISNIDRAFT_499347 [Sistotremastrum niveocremeum HHB9708]
MLVAKGMREAFRLATTATRGGGGRSIHIHALPRRPVQAAGGKSAIRQAGQYIAQMFTQGFSGTTNAVHSKSANLNNTIKSRFSLPVRHALSRPLGAPVLPRAPALPRSVAQVGLGTARNFSSARPIFQNLVENVPVAGRAFWEIDWDSEMRKKSEFKARSKKGKQSQFRKTKEVLKPKNASLVQTSQAEEEETSSELSLYFQEPPTPSVTTYLSIPLAPTPTARLPLTSEAEGHSRPLALPALAHLHTQHETHSTRVASLFNRLDRARVWDRGVSCEASGDPSGLCTLLRVKFSGWTGEEVRAAIGLAGHDWCWIEEVRQRQEDDHLLDFGGELETASRSSSDLKSGTSFMTKESSTAPELVMPVLDFSTSSPSGLAMTSHPPTFDSIKSTPFTSPPTSSPSSPFLVPTSLHSLSDPDELNLSSEDEWHWSDQSSSDGEILSLPDDSSAIPLESWRGLDLGFSARFLERAGAERNIDAFS